MLPNTNTIMETISIPEIEIVTYRRMKHRVVFHSLYEVLLW